ncbi:MAG: CinA family protein [Victivallales bacterium]|nr:CinA family protein [Victivallales bacterium]
MRTSNLRQQARQLGNILLAQGRTLATAESLTGGGIAAELTAVPGSSRWFRGAFVTYVNDWKHRFLGVPQETLERFDAVSSQTVHAMLKGLRERSGVDCAMAVSGFAGPGGGLPDRPVGTVFVGIAGPGWESVQECHFTGTRSQIRRQTVRMAIGLMLDQLEKTHR